MLLCQAPLKGYGLSLGGSNPLVQELRGPGSDGVISSVGRMPRCGRGGHRVGAGITPIAPELGT